MGRSCNKLSPDITLHSKDMMMGLLWYTAERLIIVALLYWYIFVVLIFLLFFIPGTPKDLLTYFVGLTDIKLVNFLLLSLIARIPSVLSSTFGGHLIGEGRYSGAVLLYAAVGTISLLGIFLYNYIIKKRNK